MALAYQQMKQAVKTVISAGNVPNIVGEAGIGKSALVAEVAQELGARIFTTVVSLAEKGDLAIPVPPLREESFVQTTKYGELANVQYGYSETLIQIIRHAEMYPEQSIIWFLDEFNRGTVAVQSELMNLVLQREINGLQLPHQVRIVLAENPDDSMTEFSDTDYSVTPADAAIKDRTVRLVMQASLNDWLQWAQQKDEHGNLNIDPLIQEYLAAHPDYLTGPKTADLFPTPRAWQRVSKNLHQLNKLAPSDQQSLMADIFSGDLGNEVGVAFTEFVLQHGHQLTVGDLISKPVSETLPQLTALSESDKVQLLVKLTGEDPEQFLQADFVQRYMNYLEKLSPDGQYAVIQEWGKISSRNPELLAELYRHADVNEVFANFYKLLQKIATR